MRLIYNVEKFRSNLYTDRPGKCLCRLILIDESDRQSQWRHKGIRVILAKFVDSPEWHIVADRIADDDKVVPFPLHRRLSVAVAMMKLLCD